ncbi:putative leukotriene A-4 hydrolase like protein [Microthyrium microscopicum]|uniref:Leukotriene A(4) hydrolase n=1 Tax=Microthyrium microscopicum TaxID=703497 RepID=A0A6A6TZ83_9PEZI|nr:putative leukotriene A-4 hydrolase like protein [Microthyrium microscopicum]
MAANRASRPRRDPNTNSNYEKIVTSKIAVNYDIDFGKKRLEGNVVLSMKALVDGVKDIVLDTSFLDIKSVIVEDAKSEWTLKDRKEPYGSPLVITLAEGISKGKEVQIDVALATTNECTALQWLDPAQTPNKKHPYMFSQCQAIHARSVLPCQDTPDVKAPVTYTLRSPHFTLASGHLTTHDEAANKYTYEQPIPIPSYLIAFASGDIKSLPIGPRSQVYSGPDEVKGCQWEFEDDTENYIKIAESIVFEYAWKTYNVLVLPNSFPYGGMENPVVTFATPTVVSKDRANIDVIAHELSHSWSGNLVSNASWEHFWLNEGWTTYLERRIQARLHGEPHRDFSAIIGWKALEDSIKGYGEDHEYTKLVLNLDSKDPDDAFSSIPYEKGYVFIDYLEKLVSREKWDKFIPHYFGTWKLKSLDSFEFKATLLDFFASDSEATNLLNSVAWDDWFYKPGFPPKPNYDDTLVKGCYALAEKWHARSSQSFTPNSSDIDGWTANQSVVFLEKIQSYPAPPIPKEDVVLLGDTYGYAKSSNVELVSRYFAVGLMAKEESVYKPTGELLGTVGRMKFVRPLFRLLEKCDRKYAIEVFEKNKNFYHPICRAMVEKDLFGDKKA